jgi:hypothetical protein
VVALCATEKNGNFVFWLHQRTVLLQPAQVLKESLSPRAFMANLEIFNSLNNPNYQHIILVNEQKGVKLQYKQISFNDNRLMFRNYALANQVDSAYMLKGLEDTWYTVTDPNNVNLS